MLGGRLTEEINAIIEQKKLKHEASREPQLGHSDRHARSALEEAAQEAAIADGVLPMSLADIDKHDGGTRCKHALRRGKWTPEEEAYARRLIEEFKRGNLPLSEGTTLRTFLSKLLNCDPMRISKKFVGHNCIGKVRWDTVTICTVGGGRWDVGYLERFYRGMRFGCWEKLVRCEVLARVRPCVVCAEHTRNRLLAAVVVHCCCLPCDCSCLELSFSQHFPVVLCVAVALFNSKCSAEGLPTRRR